jgi:hypothetical protein
VFVAFFPASAAKDLQLPKGLSLQVDHVRLPKAATALSYTLPEILPIDDAYAPTTTSTPPKDLSGLSRFFCPADDFELPALFAGHVYQTSARRLFPKATATLGSSGAAKVATANNYLFPTLAAANPPGLFFSALWCPIKDV